MSINLKVIKERLDKLERQSLDLYRQLNVAGDEDEKSRLKDKIILKEQEYEKVNQEFLRLKKSTENEARNQLAALLEPINSLSWRSIYNYLKSKNYAESNPNDLQDALAALEEMQPDRFSYSPVLNFVACCYLLDDLEEALIKVQVKNWMLNKIEEDEALRGLTAESIIEDTKKLIREREQLDTTSPHLLFRVKFREADDRYDIEAFLVPNIEQYEAQSARGIVEGFDPLRKFEKEKIENKGFVKTQLEDALIQCLDEVPSYIKGTGIKNLTVHAFIEISQLHQLQIDQFKTADIANSPSVGNKYNFIYRLSTRDKKYRQFIDCWEDRWKIVCNTCRDKEPQSFESLFISHPDDPKTNHINPYNLIDDLEKKDNEKKVGLLLTRSSQCCDENDSNVFTVIAQFGVPIALWPRQDGNILEESWSDFYQNKLLQGNLADIPQNLKEQRKQADSAHRKGKNHWGKHIGFLWEDPRLILPQQKRFRMPT